MKNKTMGYLAKIHNQQSMESRKMLADSVRNYEAAMSELKNIYMHEKQLLIAIPMLIQSATTFELIQSLTAFNKYTKKHIKKLEANFPSLSETTSKNKLN